MPSLLGCMLCSRGIAIKIMERLLGTILLLLLVSPLYDLHAGDADDYLQYLLKKIENPPADKKPRESIYSRNEIIFCTGNSKLANANNRAAELMEKGDYAAAEAILAEALKNAPLFFPLRYNIGLCHVHLNNLKVALIHMQKALYVFPEYSKTYLQIGYIYQRFGKDSTAIDYFRGSLERNSKELTALTLIGDIYFNRKQYEVAKKYYQASLKIDRRLPNGLLGLAKIHYIREKFYRALILLKSIDLTRDYDKSLHYYYAECSFNLRDYESAYEQYNNLLRFRNDKFFLTNSIALIKHKLDLTRRFIER